MMGSADKITHEVVPGTCILFLKGLESGHSVGHLSK